MKIIGLIAITLACSLNAAAATSETNAKAESEAFLNRILAGRPRADLIGASADGRVCTLTITDRTNMGDRYYVTVYPTVAKMPADKNDFIGVNTVKAVPIVLENEIQFSAEEGWGNDSHLNQITISVENGHPVRARGLSDLQNIDCKL